MASCDASTHNYTYDDHPGDMNLTRFNLTMEDYKYRVILGRVRECSEAEQ